MSSPGCESPAGPGGGSKVVTLRCPPQGGREIMPQRQRGKTPRMRYPDDEGVVVMMDPKDLALSLDLPKRAVALVLAGGRGSRLKNLTDRRYRLLQASGCSCGWQVAERSRCRP